MCEWGLPGGAGDAEGRSPVGRKGPWDKAPGEGFLGAAVSGSSGGGGTVEKRGDGELLSGRREGRAGRHEWVGVGGGGWCGRRSGPPLSGLRGPEPRAGCRRPGPAQPSPPRSAGSFLEGMV